MIVVNLHGKPAASPGRPATKRTNSGFRRGRWPNSGGAA